MKNKICYRPCVGVALFNSEGLVWLGQRLGTSEIRSEYDKNIYTWQMPQGGINTGEQPLKAAQRELFEETNIRSISFLKEASDWFSYDLPQNLIKKSWRGQYRGQTQKWFAFLFTGNDTEINIHNPADGSEKAEFSEWRWVELQETQDLVVPFKRNIYKRVISEFLPIAQTLKSQTLKR